MTPSLKKLKKTNFLHRVKIQYDKQLSEIVIGLNAEMIMCYSMSFHQNTKGVYNKTDSLSSFRNGREVAILGNRTSTTCTRLNEMGRGA